MARQVNVYIKYFCFVTIVIFAAGKPGPPVEYTIENVQTSPTSENSDITIVTLDKPYLNRIRRDISPVLEYLSTGALHGAPAAPAPTPPAASIGASLPAPATPSVAAKQSISTAQKPDVPNGTPDSNKTSSLNKTEDKTNGPTTVAPATRIPLLGVNGSGQVETQIGQTPMVSDPIVPDNASNGPVTMAPVTQVPLLTVTGSEQTVVETQNPTRISGPVIPRSKYVTEISPDKTPVRIVPEQNLANLTYDQHEFYNSTFIGNVSYFNQHWNSIFTDDAHIHVVLSNSHRRATAIKLSFDFPYYGHKIRNVTVATGGFLYTGEHMHNWLAATQYIAPLMANFDTTMTEDSLIKFNDDGEKFTVIWENVTLQEDKTKKFTFAVTLYKNGDIIFAYKNIPIDVQVINDAEHPVKVGISDAYLSDQIMFYVRRKTIYEYHRVSFKDHLITSNTMLKIIALPSCLQYETCESCLNHNTSFICTWCPAIQRCSSGTDRNKQDWYLGNCKMITINNETRCAPSIRKSNEEYVTGQISYSPKEHEEYMKAHKMKETTDTPTTDSTDIFIPPTIITVKGTPKPEPDNGAGEIVGTVLTVAFLMSLVIWIVYAFKYPHTPSGQFLIRYRPSQWTWRCGEARYTAATIHM